MPKQRRTTKRISTLRTETQRQQLARLMFRGWSTKQIARKLHVRTDTVRDLSHTVEFSNVLCRVRAGTARPVGSAPDLHVLGGP